jgi:hypothetical protein
VQTAIKGLGGIRTGKLPHIGRKPKFSKAGLARIRAAQKKRWAKIRALMKK